MELSIFSTRGASKLRAELNRLGIEFSTRDTQQNGFWGTKFMFPKPRGKGATKRLELIRQICDLACTSNQMFQLLKEF